MRLARAALLLALTAAVVAPPAHAALAVPSTALPTGLVIKDGVDKRAPRDIKEVRIWQRASQPGFIHVAVRFRRTTPNPEVVGTNIWFNTDKDKQPEFLAVSDADINGDWRALYPAKTWRNVDYDTNLLDTNCAAVQIGQRPSAHVNFPCLGIEPKSVSVNAVDAFGGDGATLDMFDFAPGQAKWSRRVKFLG